MRKYTAHIKSQPVTIYQVEGEDDLRDFRQWAADNRRALALDTETTGLDIFSPTFRVRTVQFGTRDEAYVIPVEKGRPFSHAARSTLVETRCLVLHNASFDLQVLDQHLEVPLESLWPKVRDTRIFAHLVDPRGKEEGGIGHALEDLVAHYLDPEVAENVKGLMTKLAKEHKTTKAKIWKTIDLDHPEYNLYAGMDPILAARLIGVLAPKLQGTQMENLLADEHKVAEICSYMERGGFLLDVEYTRDLQQELSDTEEYYRGIAAQYGCENVNSTEQVADALEAMGVEIPGRTPTGKRKVDKVLLSSLVKQGNPLAQAVVEAKKARKWRTTWVDGFLDSMDDSHRVHPSINSLRARTARMSITGIPAQTLPSGDHMIRSCFIADPDQLIVSVDYQAQELRVLAALSGDRRMIEAFERGEDLHLITARAAFGDHITKDDPERKYAKVVNFGRVYGGGARTVAEQTGLDLKTAKRVVEGFDAAYPGVTRYSQKLQRQAERLGYIVTPVGRRLPVDPERPYAALNYMVQSTSRDVTARALQRLHAEGFTQFLRLPIHDEILASLPAAEAEEGARAIADCMREQMGPVLIDTDPEVYGRSWGDGYK